MKTEQTFVFRKMSAAALESLLENLDQQIDVEQYFEVAAQDEQGKPTHYRRRPETHTIEIPDWVSSIPELAQKWITQEISNFVKTVYIDNFAPVGPHDWATIEREAATSGRGSGRISISEELLKLAAGSFGTFITQATGAPAVGEAIAKAVQAKFSQNAITKHLGECTPEIIDKVQARLDSWAEHLVESGSEDADELADAYSFLSHRLTKVKEKLTTKTADIIRDVL